MGYEKAAISITIFSVFFATVTISGGIAEFASGDELESTGITKEDLKFSPDLPNPNPQKVNLKEDVVESENVDIVDASSLNNTEFDSDYVVELDNQSNKGWVLYRLQKESNFVTTQATKYGFLESPHINMQGYVTANTDSNPTEEIFLRGQQTFEIENPNTNFIRFVMYPSEDRLYSLAERPNEKLGTFDAIGAYFGSAIGSLTAWFTLITQLPSVLWMLGSAIGIIGVLIIIKLVLP